MADPKYGSSEAGFKDAIARMGAQSAAQDELKKKLKDLEKAEADSEKATRGNVGARSSAVGAIEAQIKAVSDLATALGRETGLLTANTQAWRANAGARGEASAASARLVGVGTASPGAAGGRYGATSVGFKDAIAQADAGTVAAKELEQKAAQLAAAEAAAQTAATVAAQRALLRPPGLPPSLTPREQLALPPGGQKLLPAGPPIYPPNYYLGQPALPLGGERRPGAFVAARTGAAEFADVRDATYGGAAALGQYTAEEEKMLAVNQRVITSLAGVGAEQRAANAAFNLSVAEYAASSQALQRHGALSTEFIQGLARGEVTLAEFGTALTATIGKFAGWAVAGGLVYGAYEALKRITEGATHTATGVARLERSIPGLDKRQAEEGFREVGRRVNVPIAQVADAQFYAARAGFHGQRESLEAGETALLAEKLDQVPIQDAAKALGAVRVAFNLNAKEIRSVFNELDIGQLKFNARLNQTLPQLGRAASAFSNAGGSVQQLTRQLVEVVGQTGGGGGQGGGQPATLFVREPTNVAKPTSQAVLREYGFNPQEALTHIGNFNETLQRRAAIKEGQPGYLSDEAIRELGKAIGGGGALGGRYGIALIQQGRTGRDEEVVSGLSKAGPAAQEDLTHTLHQFNEQFSAIGNTFERVGSEIGAGGVVKVGEDFITVLHLVAEGFELAAKPLGDIGRVINGIPGPLQQLFIALAAGAAITRVARSEKGIGLSQAAGQAPGLGFLQSDQKQALQKLQRTTSEGLVYTQQEGARESARKLGIAAEERRAVAEKARFAAGPEGRELTQLSGEGRFTDQRTRDLQTKAAFYDSQIEAVQVRARKSEEALLSNKEVETQLLTRKADLSSKSLSVSQRLQKAAAEDVVSATAGKPGVPLQAGRGTVGAAAEARSPGGVILPVGVAAQEAATEIKAAGTATTDSLESSATGIRAATVPVEDAFALAAAEIRAGGAAVADGLYSILLGGGVGKGLAGIRGGLGGIGAGLTGGLGAGLSGLGSNLLKGFFTAYIGTAIADIIGKEVIGGKAGSKIGGIGGDAAIGAGIGTVIPIIGPGFGAVAGAVFGGGKALGEAVGGTPRTPQQEQALLKQRSEERAKRLTENEERLGSLESRELGKTPAIAALVKSEGRKIGAQGESNAERLESAAEEYGQEIQQAFKDEGEGAQKAKGNIEKHLRIIEANLKLFGQTSGRGRPVQETLEADLTASVKELLKNPSQADQATALIEKTLAASQAASKEEFSQSLKRARTPGDVLAAQQRLEGVNRGLVKAAGPTVETGLTQELASAKEGQASTEAALRKLALKGQGAGSQAKDLRAKLAADTKEVESLQRLLAEFHELAPRIFAKIEALNQEAAAEGTYKKLGEQQAAGNARKLAEAGSNPAARAKAEREIERQGVDNRNKAYKGKYPAQEQTLREEQITHRVEREQSEQQAQLGKIEREGARRIASLPRGASKAAADAIRAQTEARRLAYIRRHENTFGGTPGVEDAEIKKAEAERAGAEAGASEASSLVSARGQLRQAQDQGNAVAQANDAAATAHELLGVAKTESERISAMAQIVAAANQLQQALQQRTQELGELVESKEPNALEKEHTKIGTTRKLLANAKGPDEKIKLQAQLNNEVRQYAENKIGEAESEYKTLEHLNRLVPQQRVEKLQALLRSSKGISKKARLQLEAEIYDAENETSKDFGVGNIKLPTLYDAKTLTPRGGGTPPNVNFTQLHSPPQLHQTNHINVNVTGGDPHKVITEIERAFRVTTKAQLRSARLTH